MRAGSDYLTKAEQLAYARTMQTARRCLTNVAIAKGWLPEVLGLSFLLLPRPRKTRLEELAAAYENGGPSEELLAGVELRGEGIFSLQNRHSEEFKNNLHERYAGEFKKITCGDPPATLDDVVQQYANARNALVENINDWLVMMSMKHTYRCTSYSVEDIHHALVIDVLRALDTFDPTRDVTLITFLRPYIRDHAQRHLHELQGKEYLLHPRRQPQDEKEQWMSETMARVDVQSLLGHLKGNERAVLEGVAEGTPLSVIARRLGISRQRAYQLKKQALARLREALTGETPMKKTPMKKTPKKKISNKRRGSGTEREESGIITVPDVMRSLRKSNNV